MSERTLQERLRWGAKAIFLATEPEVAADVRELFLKAADRIDALEKALNPRRWTREMSDAWHRGIPDLQTAFDALARSALNPKEPT